MANYLVSAVLVLHFVLAVGSQEQYEKLDPFPDPQPLDPVMLMPRAAPEPAEFDVSGSGGASGSSGDMLLPITTESTITPSLPSSPDFYDNTKYLALTFTALSQERYHMDGLQYRIPNVLTRLLDLPLSPAAVFDMEEGFTVVLVYFPASLNVTTTSLNLYAELLDSTDDSEWSTISDNYDLLRVAVGSVDVVMPWWHWLLIALIGVLAALGYVMVIIACCCRLQLKKRNASKVSYKKWDAPSGDNMPLQEVNKLQMPEKSRQQLVRKVSRVSFQPRHLHSHLLSIKDLEFVVANPSSLLSEYALVPSNMVSLAEVPSGAEEKNRYRDVLPNPQTRVALFLKFGVANSDYINANYIRGYKNSSKSYIATQGPLHWTVADFWRMVWEQRCSTIIMTTKLEEKGMAKCVQYWPEERHSHSILYEDLEVHLRRRVITKHYSTTTLLLQHKEKMVSREVTHFWFTGWPDHDVPSSVQLFVEFLLHVQKHMHSDVPGPTVVHCSAGIGRTGVFIGADIGIQQLDNEGEVDVLKILSSLRQDRGGMIQTKEQYIFLHQVLLAYAMKYVVQRRAKNLLQSTPEEEPSLETDTTVLLN